MRFNSDHIVCMKADGSADPVDANFQVRMKA